MGFYVNVYIILVVFFGEVCGMGYMALSGSMRGFNRSWIDLFTKKNTKKYVARIGLREGNRVYCVKCGCNLEELKSMRE